MASQWTLFIVAAAACLAGTARGARLEPAAAALRSSAHDLSVEKPQAVEQHLRICNGYASAEPLEIYRLPSEKLTQEPLPFKTCKDFTLALGEVDKLDFRAASDISVGVFTATGVPRNTGSLLLVAQRRNEHLRAATFQSHSFAGLQTAQVAVIDAFSGPGGKGHVEIEDREKDEKKSAMVQSHAESLQYNSVIAVNPGAYSVSLVDPAGKKSAVQDLDASAGGTYVLMRVGQANAGDSFKEDMVLFGGAGSRAPLFVTLVLAALAHFARP